MKAKFLTFFGTALTLVLAGQSAIAQSPSPTTEIELSPEGFQILCERFPLNSRCGGMSTPTSPTAPSEGAVDNTMPESGETMTRPAGPPSSPGAPDSVTVPEASPANPGVYNIQPSPNTMPASPGSMDQMNPSDMPAGLESDTQMNPADGPGGLESDTEMAPTDEMTAPAAPDSSEGSISP